MGLNHQNLIISKRENHLTIKIVLKTYNPIFNKCSKDTA